MTTENNESAAQMLFQKQMEEEARALGLTGEGSEASSEESKSTESTETTIEPQYSEIELEQMEAGWKPKDQWINEGGDPDDWVPAKQYKRVGEIIDSKRKASREVKELREKLDENTNLVKNLVEHNKAIEKATREATLREIEQRRLQAVEEGDRDAFLKAESDRIKMEQQAQLEVAKPQVQEPAPISQEVKDFQERHKDWLTSEDPVDQAMQAVVKERVSYYMQNNPNIDESVAIREIEQRLKTAFPHKFADSKPTVSKVSVSTTTTSSSPNKYSLSRLDHEQKATYELIKRADPSYKLDEFIDQLEKIGKLGK